MIAMLAKLWKPAKVLKAKETEFAIPYLRMQSNCHL